MSNLTAGILIIGEEILSGRTQDTNSNFIAKNLVKFGIKLEEIKVIHDDKQQIISNVLDFHKKYSYVFTSGGIGPTHDDITSESIAFAFKKKYCLHPKAYKILEQFYPKGEFNKSRQKMAMMPENVELIYNPLTAAPGFIIKNIFILPGVPKILEKMFFGLSKKIKKGVPKKSVTINTNLFESLIANDLDKIQTKFPDCFIGSYPYYDSLTKNGGVNVVISSWTLDNLDLVEKEIKDKISLLGGNYYIV